MQFMEFYLKFFFSNFAMKISGWLELLILFPNMFFFFRFSEYFPSYKNFPVNFVIMHWTIFFNTSFFHRDFFRVLSWKTRQIEEQLFISLLLIIANNHIKTNNTLIEFNLPKYSTRACFTLDEMTMPTHTKAKVYWEPIRWNCLACVRFSRALSLSVCACVWGMFCIYLSLRFSNKPKKKKKKKENFNAASRAYRCDKTKNSLWNRVEMM